MARVKGQDVFLELMDAVAKLEATAVKHADLLDSAAAHMVAASVRMNDLSRRVNQRTL